MNVQREIWECDFCGGAARWTFLDGVVHYYCQDGCEGFGRGVDTGVILDTVGSVSAVERNGTEMHHDGTEASKGSRREDLPF